MCGSSNAAIIDSRYMDNTGWRRRRRECPGCRYRWSTIEVPLELLSELRVTMANLKTIERLATEGRLAMLDSKLAMTILSAPEAPAQEERPE